MTDTDTSLALRGRTTSSPSASEAEPRRWSLPEVVLCVLLPYSTGYLVSYYFRTVNAVLSARLTSDFDLTAAQLGVMTATYFLVAALAQLPLGWALDRHGPRRVQSCCLLVAALGASLFAVAGSFTGLLVARALIGLGVASALLAGMKALAMSAQKRQLGLLNGVFMSIGAAGAIAASTPTELLLQSIDWRELLLLASATAAASAAMIFVVTPSHRTNAGVVSSSDAPSPCYKEIFRARAFWQIAPLSATAIGSAWALQGLWSAPWLRDVAHLDQSAISAHLFFMAVSLSIGALSFGIAIHWLGRRGIAPDQALVGAALLYIIAELSLAFAWPVPSLLPWCVVSTFAAGTVLTFTMSAQRFPKESVGRANSAFNLLHFTAAFAAQTGLGFTISHWPRDAAGHYPPEAYRDALLMLVVTQAAAVLMFIILGRERRAYSTQRAAQRLTTAAMVCLLFLLQPTSALGDILDDCTNEHVPADAAKACSVLIESTWATDRQLVLAFNNRANALAYLGRSEEAIMDFSRAIALDPHYVNARYNRATTYQELGNDELAIADFNFVLKLEPGRIDALNNRGLAFLKTGDLESAIADFSAAIDVEPTFAIAFNNRGVAWRRKGILGRALQEFEMAVELNPRYVGALNSRGEVHLALGHTDEAIRDFRRALEINPSHVAASRNLRALVSSKSSAH